MAQQCAAIFLRYVGRDRAAAYREALAEFNTLQRSVLDVAQQSGLVDPSARKLWESEFYVPFYRVMEDDATGTMGGPDRRPGRPERL